MRHFYILGFAPDNEMGNALELAECVLSGFEPSLLKKGTRLGTFPEGLVFRVKTPAHPNARVIVNAHGFVLISSDLGNCLESIAPHDVELISVPVLNRDGFPLRTKFVVVNALRKLDALSERKTVRSPLSLGDIKPVLKMGLVGSKVPIDAHVFRVLRWDYPLVVDDAIRRGISGLMHDGLVFIPVEQE